VPRMLRSAISAFTRVFDTLWRCVSDPGPSNTLICVGPGSAEQREGRCIASGTRPLLRRKNFTPACRIGACRNVLNRGRVEIQSA